MCRRGYQGQQAGCGLCPHEFLLWSSLAFRILTYEELRAEFYEKERELHILGELDFDHYLNRLIMRGLVASGRDCIGIDTLYGLLGHLYTQSVPDGILVRTVSFLKFFLSPPDYSPWLEKAMLADSLLGMDLLENVPVSGTASPSNMDL